jgi:hypothetical protein
MFPVIYFDDDGGGGGGGGGDDDDDDDVIRLHSMSSQGYETSSTVGNIQ